MVLREDNIVIYDSNLYDYYYEVSKMLGLEVTVSFLLLVSEFEFVP